MAPRSPARCCRRRCCRLPLLRRCVACVCLLKRIRQCWLRPIVPHAGFTLATFRLLAFTFGPSRWLLHAGVAAARCACHGVMTSARSPTAHGGTKLFGLCCYALCTAVYWLPAGQACCAVGAAMLGCQSMAQLPAALLKPAVFWQLALVLLACERWVARAFSDMALLMSQQRIIQAMAQAVAACDGRFGSWLPDTCRHALTVFSPQVSCLPAVMAC